MADDKFHIFELESHVRFPAESESCRLDGGTVIGRRRNPVRGQLCASISAYPTGILQQQFQKRGEAFHSTHSKNRKRMDRARSDVTRCRSALVLSHTHSDVFSCIPRACSLRPRFGKMRWQEKHAWPFVNSLYVLGHRYCQVHRGELRYSTLRSYTIMGGHRRADISA